MINTENESNCVVGGDFNMEKEQLNKKIVKGNMNMRRIDGRKPCHVSQMGQRKQEYAKLYDRSCYDLLWGGWRGEGV